RPRPPAAAPAGGTPLARSVGPCRGSRWWRSPARWRRSEPVDGGGVPPLEGVGEVVDVEPGGRGSALLDEVVAQEGLLLQASDGLDEGDRVTGPEQDAVAAVHEELP